MVTISNSSLSVQLDTTGIQAIALAGKTITIPAPDGTPPQGFFNSGAFAESTELPTSSAFHVVGTTPTSARISGSYSNGLFVDTTYQLSNSDLILTIRLNNSSSAPFENLAFGLPSFGLGQIGISNMPSWRYPYLVATSQDVTFHPGLSTPLAMQYMRGDGFAAALHAPTHFGKRSLFNAFTPSYGFANPNASIQFYSPECIGPGENLIIKIVMHFTTASDIALIASTYLADMQAFLGPANYTTSDNRPWWETVTSDPSVISNYESWVTPLIGKAAGGIFWQPQGDPGRGCQYRPDFDIFPPDVEPNLVALFRWMSQNGFVVGLLARPNCFVTPLNYTTDQIVTLDASNPSQVQMLLTRIANVRAMGVGAFYFDSFGSTLNDWNLMKQIRAAIGPSIPTFSEWMSDLMVNESGMYAEPGFDAQSTSRYSGETVAILRLINPSLPILMKADGAGAPEVATLISNRWTPLMLGYNAAPDAVAGGIYSEFSAALVNNQWPQSSSSSQNL